MRFIKDSDYSMLILQEIRNLLAADYNDHKLVQAEITAISQIKNHIATTFDTDKIFDPEGDRDAYMIMIVIDLALYHLYSSKAKVQMPDHRSLRYEDAFKFIREDIYKSSLPRLNEAKGKVRIKSKPKKNNRW
ncbi:MAG: DUF1320 domain-containing protein [Bacteroidales bacterium]|jgi:hypothetical protein|nr:DUF1320 domain-containing protein [Bacteroidales bacterium]